MERRDYNMKQQKYKKQRYNMKHKYNNTFVTSLHDYLHKNDSLRVVYQSCDQDVVTGCKQKMNDGVFAIIVNY